MKVVDERTGLSDQTHVPPDVGGGDAVTGAPSDGSDGSAEALGSPEAQAGNVEVSQQREDADQLKPNADTSPEAMNESPVSESETAHETVAPPIDAESRPDAPMVQESPAASAETENSVDTDAQPVVESSSEHQDLNVEEAAEQPIAEAGESDVEAIADEHEEDDEGEEEVDENIEPLELIDEEAAEGDIEKDWYILKVQVNRETSICDALQRRVKVAGLEKYFGDIIVPTEDVREFTKAGKQRVVKRKLYPGYIVVHMSINDDTWFLVRETPGIGDFTGSAGKPTPMLQHEIDQILKKSRPPEEGEREIKTTIKFKPGNRVRVKEGYFQNFEGDVESIDEANGRVTVLIEIFGRRTPVELEHWQVEDV